MQTNCAEGRLPLNGSTYINEKWEKREVECTAIDSLV